MCVPYNLKCHQIGENQKLTDVWTPCVKHLIKHENNFVTQRTVGNTCVFLYRWKQTEECGVGSPQGCLFVWNTWVGQLQQWSFLPHCRRHPPKPHCGNTLNLEKGLTNAMFYYTDTRTLNLLTWEPPLASWTQKQRDCIMTTSSSLKPTISEVNDWHWLMELCFLPQ